MDKGRHPKVIRTWTVGKLRKAAAIFRRLPVVPHNPVPRNKT